MPFLRAFIRRPAILSTITIVAGASAIIGVGLGWLMIQYGSLDAGLARLRGQQIVVLPAILDIGEATTNETREGRLEVVNLSGKPAKVLGARSSCGCVLVDAQVPFELPPGESKSLSVRITFTGKEKELLHSVTVYSDLPGADSALAMVKGRLRGESVAVK